MKLATLCYIRRDGKTLMIHRVKKENDVHKDKWNGIGGKFSDGETPEECVIREVKEETGLNIQNPLLHGRIVFPAFNKQPEDWHVYIFSANSSEGEIIDSSEGELTWVADNKVFNLNLWEGDRLFMKWMKNNKFFSAKLIYEGNKLMDYTVSFYEFNPDIIM